MSVAPTTVALTVDELLRHPLPDPADASDKHERGTVLVIGGSRQTSGAVILAGLAALRAGAGKLQLATVAGAADAIAVAVPEARVVALDETSDGSIAPGALRPHERVVANADCVLVGPGTMDADTTALLVPAIVAARHDAPLVVDAAALAAFAAPDRAPRAPDGQLVLMPNPSEAERFFDADAATIAADTNAVVAVRGVTTHIATPAGATYVDESGNPGLATSGSGDVYAGVLAGLCARGADPLTAVLWATMVHGVAGERAGARIGPVGYLARELLDEIPAVLRDLSR